MQTEFGYHVIKVTDKKAPAFDDAKPQVLQKVLNDSNNKFNDVLNGSLKKAKVTVDPRYGMWNESINAVVPTDLAGIRGLARRRRPPAAARDVTQPRVVVVGLGPAGPELVTAAGRRRDRARRHCGSCARPGTRRLSIVP